MQQSVEQVHGGDPGEMVIAGACAADGAVVTHLSGRLGTTTWEGVVGAGERAEGGEGRADPGGVHAIGSLPPRDPAGDQVRSTKDGEMGGDAGLRKAKLHDEIAHRRLSFEEYREEAEAAFVGERLCHRDQRLQIIYLHSRIRRGDTSGLEDIW